MNNYRLDVLPAMAKAFYRFPKLFPLACFVATFANSCGPTDPREPFEPVFQKGVAFLHNHSTETGYGTEMAARSLAELQRLGVDSVSLFPLGYAFNLHDPRIFGYRGEDLTMTPDAIRRTIRDAHALGLKVTLVPQIWVGMFGSRGDWRGDIRMKTDADWRAWFEAYTEFILFYAKMAEEEGVELFSVGSEMRLSTEFRQRDWRHVIRAVRGVYRGPCTYSANWADEIHYVKFWDLLEYIGLSAYFPVGDGPLAARLATAGETRNQIAALSARFNKPVLFLESGFRSVPGAGSKPHAWRDDEGPLPVDLEQQRLGYDVLFQTFWAEPWFYGFYWWDWFADLGYRPNPPTDFQFRDKPAAEVLRDYYQRPAPRPVAPTSVQGDR